MIRAKQLVIAVVGALLCLFMVFLGLWQMQVFQSQAQDSSEARAAAAPVELEANLVNDHVGDLYGRQVTATGHFLPAKQFLVGSEYPMKVVSPFRTTGGRTLAVVRGTVPQGATPPAAPTGELTVTGVILPSRARATVPVASGAPTGSLASVQLERFAQEWPAPMVDGFVTQNGDLPAQWGLGLADPEIPDTGEGKTRNRGYAMQWWAFAGFGAIATVTAVRAAGRDEQAG